jgi:hypothetical protein
LGKPLFEQGDIFRRGRLELTQIFPINVRDLAGFYAFEELDQPVAFLMPRLRAHNGPPDFPPRV